MHSFPVTRSDEIMTIVVASKELNLTPKNSGTLTLRHILERLLETCRFGRRVTAALITDQFGSPKLEAYICFKSISEAPISAHNLFNFPSLQ